MVATTLPPGCGDEGGSRPLGALPGLVHLEPGLEVGRSAPDGWTHRVIRSVPRLASGELDGLPSSAGATATRFRTVIAAEVVADAPNDHGPGRRHGKRHRLARIGVGNAVPVGDLERVVTPDGPSEILDTLGVVDRVVLIAAEAKLGQGALVARTSTFALFRAPTVLLLDGEHRDVRLDYAILVDPDTGALQTFCWPLAADATEPPEAVTLLPPDLGFDVALDARPSRRVGPVAVSWSFAMSAPPPGRRLGVPDGLAPLLPPAEPIAPEALEGALRALVPDPPPRRPIGE